jgi:uncharacterized protein YndB with AHSA1/START domain
LVFNAWTNRQYLERWFATDGCTIRYKKLDVSVGGTFHSCISDPVFGDCWCIGVYKEIIKNKKIVYSAIIADEKGKPTQPASIGMDPEWPMETWVTITFRELNGITEVTLRQTVSEIVAKRTGAHPSWIKMFVRLENLLK